MTIYIQYENYTVLLPLVTERRFWLNHSKLRELKLQCVCNKPYAATVFQYLCPHRFVHMGIHLIRTIKAQFIVEV